MSLSHVMSHIDQDESVVRFVSSPEKSSIIDGVDEFFLVVGQAQDEKQYTVKHYEINGKNVERRWIHKNELLKSFLVDSNRQVVQWILLGHVIQDPTGIIESLRAELKNGKSHSHQKNMLAEYARLIRKYMEAKEFLKNGHLFDSFSSIHQALHHWARLAVIEVGEHPETTIWEQLKKIDPSVYKLYEELVISREPLEKRIELLLLALDFSVFSKMEKCVQLILAILRTRREPWTVEEILDHPLIGDRSFDIFLLLQKMVRRSLIKERMILKEGLHEKSYSIE